MKSGAARRRQRRQRELARLFAVNPEAFEREVQTCVVRLHYSAWKRAHDVTPLTGTRASQAFDTVEDAGRLEADLEEVLRLLHEIFVLGVEQPERVGVRPDELGLIAGRIRNDLARIRALLEHHSLVREVADSCVAAIAAAYAVPLHSLVSR